ncbi:MAG: TonB-dependent receptor [Kiritimatiellia bacterium]
MKNLNRVFLVGGLLTFCGMGVRAESITNIVVTANRVGNPVELVPAAVTVLDEKAVAESGALTADSLFRSLPGMDLQGSGLPGQPVRLNMRGMTSGYQSQRVLVLKDGRRLNDPFQGNVEFGLLPLYGVGRVEVVRGPASALYGSNAEGGVIQLFSRHATPGNPYGVVAAGFGEFNTREYRLEYGDATERMDYGVALGHQATDGYLDNVDGSDQDWTAMSADGNVGFSLGDAGTLRLYAGAYDGEGRDASSDRESRKDYQSAEYKWADAGAADSAFEARAYRNSDDETYNWFHPGTGQYDMQTLGGAAQYSRWANAWNRLTVGTEWLQDSVDIDESGNRIDKSTDNAAVYAQDEIELGAWRFTAGLRMDYASDYHAFWSPRLGALYQVNEACELYASVNRAHLAPSLSDRYVKAVYQGMEFVGNPELDPETLTAYETGIRVRPDANVFLQLTGFYQDLEDSFDYLMEADGVFRISNATRSSIYGGEAELRWLLPRGFSAYATLCHTEGEYDEFSMPGVEGNRIAFLAPWKSTAGLEYRTGAGSVHGLHVRYSDSRYGDAQNEVELDEAVVADWRSRVAVRKNVFLTLRVRNLLDEDYMELPGVEQPGRWTMVGFEVAL